RSGRHAKACRRAEKNTPRSWSRARQGLSRLSVRFFPNSEATPTYQRQGLSWMQFLREHSLSGVLADDMGLGKTVQTLAHILTEKEACRLDRPALIVVPTTLMHNWREEAQRFTPELRVLDLHGPQRHERFDQIRKYDVILTTYPLLWRDQSALAEHGVVSENGK
ncbi:SNF2-related protein, partial [Burkholderia multivorans]|uniref:SNF2-related protein n=1 Tax=Burkholderia multivorans TaxID=87883 RepID=UPI0020B27032